ncbi:MAG: AAA family ATPase [Acidimicrobiales bacterium]
MTIPPNPFRYGSPVSGEQFVGREAEVGAIVGRVQDHINVLLLSPRRYGKTSLLLRCESVLETMQGAVVHVNVLRCRDLGALAGALVAATYRIPGGRWHQAAQAVPSFLRRLQLRPSVTFADDGRPAFGFGPRLDGPDLDAVIGDVFDLLSEQASRRPVALVLDEFQAIVEIDSHLPKLLKSLVDEHPHVSLVAAGSKRHMMEQLFIHRGAPLYNTAQTIGLGPIEEESMIEFLCARSRAGGRSMARSVALSVIERVGPVPDDIQHLGYSAFSVATGRTVGVGDVNAGLSLAVSQQEHLYSDMLGLLAPGQRRVLRALADAQSTVVPFGAAFVAGTGLANPSSVRRALQALDDEELVVERGGAWCVADPFFATWLGEVE